MTERQPWIVCAACRAPDGFIAVGPRHFDDTMCRQIEVWHSANSVPNTPPWEQGFVDQFGRFYGREQAMQIVKDNKQPFDAERNGGSVELLFSEGLY